MKEIQGEHCQENHTTVHSVEVEFGGNNPALPTVGKLNGSIHRPDVDDEGTERSSEEHRLHFLVHEIVAGWWLVVRALEGLVADVTEDELDGEDHINGDGDHLEENAAQHDPAAQFWVLVATCSDGCEGTTNTLNSEGDEISGKEDNGICR